MKARVFWMVNSLILAEENVTPNARVTSVCEAIAARHPSRVQAFMYYGSSLRDLDDAEKMLDFKIYGLANRAVD